MYPVSYFSKSKSRKDSLHPECKLCVSIRQKKHYQKNGEIFGRQRLSTLKNRAKKYGDHDDITEEYLKELWNLQQGKCYYTGMDLVNEPHHWNTASVDRLDSKQGYIRGNMVLCCDRINLMKGELSVALFVKFCKMIASNTALMSQDILLDDYEQEGTFFHNQNRLPEYLTGELEDSSNGQSKIE